jgi:hypothetical protein
MERRKAIATAAAVTMSAVSAMFAFGVGSGALGTQSTQSPTAPQVVSQPAVAPAAASPAPLQASAQARTHEKESEGRTSQPAPQSNATTNATRGEPDD